MGKYDTCMKEFLQSKERFADLFNGCCFQGKQIILAEDLHEASENYVVPDNLSAVPPESMPESGTVPGTNNYSTEKQQEKNQKNRKYSSTELFRDVKMILDSGVILQVRAWDMMRLNMAGN